MRDWPPSWAGSVPTAPPAPPAAALARLRSLVGAAPLKGDFATKALASRKLRAASASVARRMHADDSQPYGALAALMNSAGQVAATAGDIDFTYPRGSFASQT